MTSWLLQNYWMSRVWAVGFQGSVAILPDTVSTSSAWFCLISPVPTRSHGKPSVAPTRPSMPFKTRQGPQPYMSYGQLLVSPKDMDLI